GQLGKLFGYEAATSGFVAGILALLENLLHIHWPTLILGSLSLLLMVLLPRRFPQLPGALCGVLLASLAAAAAPSARARGCRGSASANG
ncbi:hypothetical protein ACV35G_30740, partial [Pseudomonas aeruginosa]